MRLTGEADNPTHLDAPGTAPLAQTKAVARRYAAALSANRIPGAGLYATGATRDAGGGVTRGAESIERSWYDSYHEDPGVIAVRRWSKEYHLLVAPGVAVWEGAHTEGPNDLWPWRRDLVLLAVDGEEIAHEEHYFAADPLGETWPVKPYHTPPGPQDTAEAAARVGAGVGQAFATRDWAALEALLARDVIFPETENWPGVSGRDALLAWWATLAPRRVTRIVIKNETPLAGPGWAVVRWTVWRFYEKTWVFPDGIVVSANMATVIEVRGGKVARIMPYLDSEGGDDPLTR